jgi:hypothetical protein
MTVRPITGSGTPRDRSGETLFIDGRELSHMVDRTRRKLRGTGTVTIASPSGLQQGKGMPTCPVSPLRAAIAA